MEEFSRALAAIRNLKDEGIVQEYAIGGAMAFAFWSEPTPTFDLDVFVLFPTAGMLVDLGPIYAWARTHGYSEEAEHIVISGVPVQLIPAHSELAKEAIAMAAELDYAGESVRVITPEYLIALALEPSARTRKRLVRVAALLEEGNVDRVLLSDILERYQLQPPQP